MGTGDRITKRGKIKAKTYGAKRGSSSSNSRSSHKPIFCCLCGDEVIRKREARKFGKYPPKGETTEHIPQKCLYDGYGDDYKLNRLTVVSCLECNQIYSGVENDLRDYIGIINDNNKKQQELTKKGAESIDGEKNGENRIVKDEQGNVRGVIFDYNRIDKNHIKNFKGVYNKKFKSIVPKHYDIKVVYLPSDEEVVNLALKFLEENSTWEISGHDDIFRYKVVRYKSRGSTMVVSSTLRESLGAFALLEYHKSIQVLIIGRRKK